MSDRSKQALFISTLSRIDLALFRRTSLWSGLIPPPTHQSGENVLFFHSNVALKRHPQTLLTVDRAELSCIFSHLGAGPIAACVDFSRADPMALAPGPCQDSDDC
jgi:hypothetical protein